MGDVGSDAPITVTRREDDLGVPKLNVLQLAEQIPTEAAAYEYLEGLRWNGTPECPHCGHDERCYFLTPKNGTRTTRTGSATQRRLWKCAACRRQFSVLTNTVMHGTKIPVRTWVFVMFEMTASKNGLAAREIERKYGVTNRSAWFLTHRIREAMKRGGITTMLNGTIMADETFYGGSEKNKHQNKRTPGRGAHNKTPIVSLVNKETGEVRSQTTRFIAGPDLRKIIETHVDTSASVLHTDGWKGYVSVGEQFQQHEIVDHAQGEYVRGKVTTNHVEGFFSQLKRSIDGTHHHVSVGHLDRYLAEFDFRYTTRKMTDTDRMRVLVGQVGGRRLTYRPCASLSKALVAAS
jgi:transposase-like protein